MTDSNLSEINPSNVDVDLVEQITSNNPNIRYSTTLRIDSENKPKSNIDLKTATNCLRTIERIYSKFETDENKRRKNALIEILTGLESEGHKITVFFGGSIVVGQAIESSDIDISLVTELEDDPAQRLLEERISQKLPGVKVDVWQKPVNLTDINKSLDEIERTESTADISQILTIYYVFHLSGFCIGQAVEPIISRIERLADQNIPLKSAIESLVKVRLNVMGGFFFRSFQKYRTRIFENSNYKQLDENEKQEYISSLDYNENRFFTFLNFRFGQIPEGWI
ncbi:nucleotidyltransferase domain-containing protein [Candidatus Woesebacteria bacterium]|nr:nucleotidyltransferase domain-containing protein [Candidatus Woesebacteria bacterium]